MTNLKDKLSASVRQARATQQPAEDKPAAASKPAPAKPATAPKPAAAKPAVAKPKAAAAKKASTAANPQNDSALFPSRVWPD